MTGRDGREFLGDALLLLPSVLSRPPMLAGLAAAVDGDPATRVPS